MFLECLLFTLTCTDAVLDDDDPSSWQKEQASQCVQPGFNADGILELVAFLWDFFFVDDL